MDTKFLIQKLLREKPEHKSYGDMQVGKTGKAQKTHNRQRPRKKTKFSKSIGQPMKSQKSGTKLAQPSPYKKRSHFFLPESKDPKRHITKKQSIRRERDVAHSHKQARKQRQRVKTKHFLDFDHITKIKQMTGIVKVF